MTQSLTVDLKMDRSMEEQLAADAMVASMLEHYEIDSADMATIAHTDMRMTALRIAKLKEMKADFVRPAKEIIARAEALFDPAILARQAFSDGLRKKLEVYTLEQKRIADEARRRAEEEDRKRRQEAEAAAAAERAKAQAEAAEQRRQAEEAEKARVAALAAGKAAEAAKAAESAAALQAQAKATLQNAEVKAQETVMAAAAQTVVVPEVEKVSGFSMVNNWVAEIATPYTETDAVIGIAYALAGVNKDHDGTRTLVAERKDLVPLLSLNKKASDKLADALKGAMSVPCLVAVNRPYSRSTKAKG